MSASSFTGGYILERVLHTPAFSGMLRFTPAHGSGVSTVSCLSGVVAHDMFSGSTYRKVDIESPAYSITEYPTLDLTVSDASISFSKTLADISGELSYVRMPLQVVLGVGVTLGKTAAVTAVDIGFVHVGDASYTPKSLLVSPADLASYTDVYYYPAMRDIIVSVVSTTGRGTSYRGRTWVNVERKAEDLERIARDIERKASGGNMRFKLNFRPFVSLLAGGHKFVTYMG